MLLFPFHSPHLPWHVCSVLAQSATRYSLVPLQTMRSENLTVYSVFLPGWLHLSSFFAGLPQVLSPWLPPILAFQVNSSRSSGISDSLFISCLGLKKKKTFRLETLRLKTFTSRVLGIWITQNISNFAEKGTWNIGFNCGLPLRLKGSSYCLCLVLISLCVVVHKDMEHFQTWLSTRILWLQTNSVQMCNWMSALCFLWALVLKHKYLLSVKRNIKG